jgi:hypothetical protein
MFLAVPDRRWRAGLSNDIARVRANMRRKAILGNPPLATFLDLFSQSLLTFRRSGFNFQSSQHTARRTDPMNTANEILNTGDLQEGDEFSDPTSHLVATEQPEGKGIEFHVSMRGHTMADMEGLIVEAGARMLVGQFGDKALGRMIEEKCIQQVTAKADAALHAVTHEIIDQPLTPAFGDKKPVTMREFIGLTGREYLTERVDREGKPATGGGWGGSSTYTRVELLVSNYMQKHFKQEIEKATNAAIVEVQNAIRASHTSFIEAEKARLRAALAKAVA